MPWILLLLAALFTAPLSAAALPGVPTENAPGLMESLVW